MTGCVSMGLHLVGRRWRVVPVTTLATAYGITDHSWTSLASLAKSSSLMMVGSYLR